MADAYSDILNARRADIKEPEQTPVGTYVATVKEMPRVDKGGKNNNDFAEVIFSLKAPGPDVDTDKLAAAGGLPKDIKHTFWLTSKSLFIVEQFFQALGLSQEDYPGVNDALFATPGRDVTVVVQMGKPSPKTKKSYPEIASFAPA